MGQEVNNSSYSAHRYEQQQVYMDYLEDHINGVKKAYKDLFLPLLDRESRLFTQPINKALYTRKDLFYAIADVKNAINHHDDSKYTDQEFEPYRQHWYPTEEEKSLSQEEKDEIEERYQEAWVHHYTHNDHHPMFWYDASSNEVKDMDLKSIVHMICDWESFSSDKQSTPTWWNGKAVEERKYMTEKTIAIADSILKLIHPEAFISDNPNVDKLNNYIRDEYTDNKS